MSNISSRLVPILVFFVALGVLWWNAAPSVTYHDSGEMALAAASAGIPHPPGMPTWTMLASGFVRLGGFDDPARGTNLFSGLCAAAALGLLSGLVLHWTTRLEIAQSPTPRTLGAIAAPMILMASPAFLEQSFVTEQYTLMLLLIAAMVWFGSRATACRVGDTRMTANRHAQACLALTGLAWGLAIGNHLSQIALGLLAAWIIRVRCGSPLRPSDFLRHSLPVLGGLMTGLLVFLWLPLRSAKNPVMDWGYIRNWDNFVFALTRKQWPTRPISSAPRGYLHEWFVSYDIIGQIGLVGMLLALAGLFIIMRRNKHLLGWLFASCIPYATGMLLAHMREDGKNIGYIRHYGVTDWHLPIYWAGAFAAGISLCEALAALERRFRCPRRSWMAAIALLSLLGFFAGRAVATASLRAFKAPERFIREVLSVVPKDAIVAVSGDNLANMLCYDRHGLGNAPERFVVYALKSLPRRIAEVKSAGDAWTPDQRFVYLREVLMDPKFQPIRVKPPDQAQARNARIFVDHVSGQNLALPYLIPAGLLFEVVDNPVTPEQVRQIESENQIQSENLFRPPQSPPHRLEAEAYAVLHQDRGLYFSLLGLYKEAEAALSLTLAWIPDNGEVWYRLGLVQEALSQPQKAEQSYRLAIEHAYYLQDARNSLGVLLAVQGRLEEAMALFDEELALFPNSTKAAANLAKVRRDLGR